MGVLNLPSMKKILSLIITFCLISAYPFAQTFYLQGGVNLANITANKTGDVEDHKMLTTLNAGAIGRFQLTNTLQIETGLSLSGRGSKAETVFGNGDYVRAKFNPYYLEIPVNAVLTFPLNKKTGFFLHAGPYAAMGIGGKSSLEIFTAGTLTTLETEIEFNNRDAYTSWEDAASFNQLKRFDAGINVGAGLKLNNLLFRLNYGIGLTGIRSGETENESGDKHKFRTLSLSAGIPLGG